jgi:glucan phosphoethanolaminetransferase (alkaline phosphatase superfamily)
MRHLGGARASHYGQELIAIDAFLFLICCILSYAALKIRNHLKKRKSLLTIIADYLFIIALSLMTVICGLIVYEVI